MGASALASRLPNNRVVFDRSPELVEAEVLPASQVQDGQFQIVINVPENAGGSAGSIGGSTAGNRDLFSV